ncbi:MAG: NusG domain II-containing protein [Defluviitaleaceae bacterium]|nr:NusG domain II-containing protein [Defluviitaleaceae bacterium]
MEKQVKLIRIADIVLIVLMVVLAVGLIFIFARTSGDVGYVSVQIEGEVVYNFCLVDYDGEIIEIVSPNGINTIFIQDATVRIIEATCPDHDCVRWGTLSHPWLPLACLPNRVVVRLIVAPPDRDDGLPPIDAMIH